jgi:hypothetical protein
MLLAAALAIVDAPYLLEPVSQLVGINQELVSKINEVLLLERPVVQPHLHVAHELADAFGLELEQFQQLGILG